MKQKLFFSILCGLFLLTVTQVWAQGSTIATAQLINVGQQVTTTFNESATCGEAREISLDESVATTHPDNADMWYKISLTGGKVYQIYDRSVPQTYDVTCYVYVNCGATQAIASDDYFRSCVFLYPTADVTYYIKWTGAQDYTYTWNVSEVTDNRVCVLATPLTTGQSIDLPAYQDDLRPKTDSYGYKHYWFILNVEAGKYYDFDFSEANYGMWNNDQVVINSKCGGDWQDEIASFYKSKSMVKAAANAVWYIDLKRGGNGYQPMTFIVAEKTQGDNRLCEFAAPVSLNTNITADHSTGSSFLWYKINLDAGKVYEIDASNAAYGFNVYADDACNLQYPNPLAGIAKGKKDLFAPESSAVYYLQTGTSANPEGSGTWKIKETAGDNRLCAYATPIVLGTAFTVSHTEFSRLWYKIDVTAGATYEVNIPQTSYENIGIFNQCEPPHETIASGYASSFLFTAKATGSYYITFYNDYYSPTFACTVSEVTDNRSCLYAKAVAAGETIKPATMEEWFSVSLTAGKFYEFDFMDTSGGATIGGSIYSACGEENLNEASTLIPQKMLYKATFSGNHLVKIAQTGYTGSTPSSWSYAEAPNGDNRLCEFAVPINAGENITADFSNGMSKRWYKVNVNAGKYYEIPENNGIFYSGCEGEQGSQIGVPYAETARTWYVLVLQYSSYQTSRGFIINELPPDGRVCVHALEAGLNNTINTGNYHAAASFTYMRENWNGQLEPAAAQVNHGTWYRLHTGEAGNYEIRLENWEYWEQESIKHGSAIYDPHWEMYVFDDCTLNNRVVATVGHIFNHGRTTLTAAANTDYYILVDNWDDWNNNITRTWEVVKKSDASTGVLHIGLQNEQGNDVAGNQDTKVLVYSKADILTTPYTAVAYDGSATFTAYNIPLGGYIVYAENVPDYLPTWYKQIAYWSDATVVNLTTSNEAVRVDMKLLATPQIPAGNILISGVVTTTEGESIENVSVNIYKHKNQQSSAKVQAVNKVSKVDTNLWELIAVVKTDANGNYSINNLPAGQYMLVVDIAGYEVNEGAIVNASENGDYSNIDFEADEKNHTINNATGMQSINVLKLQVYPNPAKDKLIIESGGLLITKLDITDLSGRTLMSLISPMSQLNIANLSRGNYLLKVTTENGAVVKKFIKE